MILAAGVGSRLDPLTIQIPKPLCPVLGKPVMEHIVLLCREHGFTNLCANTHVRADLVSSYFQDVEKHGVKLNLVYEKELGGVAGGIRSCRHFLTSDAVLIIMGDALTDIDLAHFHEAHIKNKAEVTIAIKEVEDTTQYGVVVTDKSGRVISFQEKPKQEEAKSNLANTGIYFFSQRVLNEIPPLNEAPVYDVATHLFKKLMSKDISLYAVKIEKYWADIGTHKQYLQSIKDALDGKVKIKTNAKETNYGFSEEGVLIDKTAKIKGKVYLGSNVRIGPNVTINGFAYIEKNCEIEANSYISNSMIWPNSRIGKNAKVINSILGNNCTVESGTEIVANSVWAPDTFIKGDSKPSVVLK